MKLIETAERELGRLVPGSAAHQMPARVLLVVAAMLLCLDLVLILAHSGLRYIDLTTDWTLGKRLYGRFTIQSENAIPEFMNFFKWTLSILVLAAAYLLTRARFIAPLVCVPALLLLDDAGQMHERVGEQLAAMGMPDPAGIGAQSMGELVGFALLGVAVVLSLVMTFRWRDRPSDPLLNRLCVALAGMAFCGVFFDAFSIYVYGELGMVVLAEVIAVLEDGGEMIFITLFSFFCMMILSRETAFEQR